MGLDLSISSVKHQKVYLWCSQIIYFLSKWIIR